MIFTPKPMRPASLSSKGKPRRARGGFSLVEMLVVLAILSILAAVAMPYAEVTVKRDKELELRRDLREMRSAVDQMRADWQNGVISKFSADVSPDGFPKTLDTLVNGVDQSGPTAGKKKYLRRIPENPFGENTQPPDQQWGLRSYEDGLKADHWGGQDVYDIFCQGDEKALDGSYYHDW